MNKAQHTHNFQFTIGPVQGFVAQARRTRDFWAGSFILSWLTGVAMTATLKQGGKIVFPKPDQVFLDAITGSVKGNKPTQGTLPNRFKAEVNADFDPNIIISALNGAWQALAQIVYDADLAKIANANTKAIWDRQVTGFFETSWAMSEVGNALPVIDLRKNWRSHYPQAEAGHKCSLMEGWQELSGETGYHATDNKARKDFWGKVRNQKGFGRDLVENEHLCALAFIKRRFAHHFHALTGDYKGWELEPHNVPSVALLAALPAINLIKQAGEQHYEAFKNFSQAFAKAGGEFGEERSLPTSIADIKAFGLDGIAWFSNTYDNPASNGLSSDTQKVRAAQKALKDLYDQTGVREPSPFYAILMMDGDSLGKQMSDSTKQSAISEGLNRFTKDVNDIVKKHNGFLIYAGGDDVLAILPIDTALGCAKELRDHYIDSFMKGSNQEIVTSISAAVIFAHIKTALSTVLHDAHHVLDDAAKDGAGRDALAVQVIKNSGKHLLWAMPWNKLLNDKEEIKLQVLAKQLRGKNKKDGSYNPENLEASTKFFYGIREHFTRLVDPKKDYNKADADLITDMLAVDYKQSGVSKDKVKSIQDAKSLIEPLLEQCTPHKRTNEVKVTELANAKIEPVSAPKIDGALLVRFLAFRGQDRT
jgi:CRISPR-associated protein Cmr2